MNLKQAAAELGVHYQTAYKLVRRGRLDAVKIGGRYQITPAAIERYLQRRDSAIPALDDGPDDDLTAAITGAALADPAPAGDAAVDQLLAAGADLAWLIIDGQCTIRHRHATGNGLARMLLDDPIRGRLDTAGVIPAPANPPATVPFIAQDRLRDLVPAAVHQHLGGHGLGSVAVASVGDGELGIARTPQNPPVDTALVEQLGEAADALELATAIVQTRQRAWQLRSLAIEELARDSDAEVPTGSTLVTVNPSGQVIDVRGENAAAWEDWVGRPFTDHLDRRSATVMAALYEGHLRQADVEIDENSHRYIASTATSHRPEPGSTIAVIVPVG